MFGSLERDHVTVIKQDGQRFESQPASVQKDRIYMNGSKLLIEPGDIIERVMSNGGKETYRVIDPGWHEGSSIIPSGYQMNVENLSVARPAPAMQSVTYNINGDNARVNNHSVDNSTNVVGGGDEVAKVLLSLREEIQSLGLSVGQRQDALDLVDAAEAQFASGSPKKGVLKAILDGLPAAERVVTFAGRLYELAEKAFT